MRIDKSLIVARKDWLEIRRNWQVIMPVIILPVVLSVLMPIALANGFSTAANDSKQINITNSLPIDARADAAGLDQGQAAAYIMLLYLFAPFFLIIPLMASSVIASDSFAGEKERKTTEALLATPITDSELLLGKIIVSFVPAMLITIFSFIVYSAIADSMFVPIIHHIVLPNASWLLLVFALAPALTITGIGATVLISSKVKGFREAQQISGLLLLPILALVIAQLSGMLFFGPAVIIALTLAFLGADAVLFKIGTRIFRREELLSKI